MEFNKSAREEAKHNIKDAKDAIKKMAQDPDGREVLKAFIEVGRDKDIEMPKEAEGGMAPLKQVSTALGIAGTSALGGLGVAKLYNEWTQQAQPNEEDLKQIIEKVPEIERQHDQGQIQKAFESLGTHAPRLTKSDPWYAGQVIKKILAHEGADVQTLDKMLEIEKKKQQMGKERFKTSSADDFDSYFHSLVKKNQEIKKESQADKDVNERYKRLQSLIDSAEE